MKGHQNPMTPVALDYWPRSTTGRKTIRRILLGAILVSGCSFLFAYRGAILAKLGLLLDQRRCLQYEDRSGIPVFAFGPEKEMRELSGRDPTFKFGRDRWTGEFSAIRLAPDWARFTTK